jgi:hypothetical protein
MIRVARPTPELSPEEAYGLQVLIDLARLIPPESPEVRTGPELVLREAPSPEAGPRSLQLLVEPEVVVEPGRVVLPRALLSGVAAIAGAQEEQTTEARDPHGRVPPDANPLVRAGLASAPILSRAARSLREAAARAAAGDPFWTVCPWPEGRRWAATLTHDLDLVCWWPLSTLARMTELAKRSQGARLARVLGSAVASTFRRPVKDAVSRILKIESGHGMRSTWFSLCESPSPRTFLARDVTYRPESALNRAILTEIRARGHEVSLHGSFATVESPERMRRQRERLGAILGEEVAGVRQHFLRMRPGVTQLGMIRAGFRYDATFGFPDRAGFRLGTGDVLPGWSARSRSVLPLEEVPLIWMDRSSSKYAGQEEPLAWVEEAASSARECRDSEGLWVGVWHPYLSDPLGFPDAPRAFEELASTLRADRPWTVPLVEVVEWRAVRRGLRVAEVDEAGVPRVTVPGGEAVPVDLESPAGDTIRVRGAPAGVHE